MCVRGIDFHPCANSWHHYFATRVKKRFRRCEPTQVKEKLDRTQAKVLLRVPNVCWNTVTFRSRVADSQPKLKIPEITTRKKELHAEANILVPLIMRSRVRDGRGCSNDLVSSYSVLFRRCFPSTSRAVWSIFRRRLWWRNRWLVPRSSAPLLLRLVLRLVAWFRFPEAPTWRGRCLSMVVMPHD